MSTVGSVAILAQDYGQSVRAKRSLPLRLFFFLTMAAALTLEAHGQVLRIAAELAGVHFQGLGAVAGRLRKCGITNRSLLRRLAALDAAAAVLRHITVVSTQRLEDDLRQAFYQLESFHELEGPQMDQKDTQEQVQKQENEVEDPQEVPASINIVVDTAVGTQEVTMNKPGQVEPQLGTPLVMLVKSVDHDTQQAALAK